MSRYRTGLNILVFAAVAGLVCACASKAPPATSASAATAAAAPIVGGTALPPGYKIDAGRTLILGADDKWTGRLSYTSSTAADEVFDFLHREMPNFGWTETTSMRSDISLLTFVSENTSRVATIHIERGSMLGGSTRVDMVVSARDTPSVPPSPSKSVTSAPLRQPAH